MVTWPGLAQRTGLNRQGDIVKVNVWTTVRRHWPWALIPLLGSLLLTAYRYLEVVATGGQEPLLTIMLKETSSALGTVLLLWPTVLVHRRFPLFNRGWYRRLPAQILGLLTYSFVHTSWNWGVRSALYPLLGLGSYNYGRMPTRYFMEFPLDLIVFVIVGVVVLVVDRAKASKDQEVQVVTLQEQLQRTQLTQLQSQLRPHFLFNSLNTVSSVMYEDVDRADGVLQALSDILRRMVDQSDSVVVALREELHLIRSAVEIMEARFPGRLAVRFEVAEEANDWPVPPLLLQPLVENAIQHGMPEHAGALKVLVRASKHGDNLRIEVQDNGPGLNGTGLDPSGSGVGLRNTRDRLTTQYAGDARFELLEAEGGGLHIVMEIPWTDSAR